MAIDQAGESGQDTLLKRVECAACKGSGKIPVYALCRTCNGEGSVGPWYSWDTSGTPCPSRCGEGSNGQPGMRGHHIAGSETCASCRGHGHYFIEARQSEAACGKPTPTQS